MKCKACKREMANVFPEGTRIDKNRFKVEVIGYSCVNVKCKKYKRIIK